MRLFIGVWPSVETSDRLEELERPVLPELRWTTPDQWHVTLAFLGEVPDSDRGLLVEGIAEAAAELGGPLDVEAGPVTSLLGRSVLCVRVAGLEPAAAALRATGLARYVQGEDHRFNGHVTLARARHGNRVPAYLAGFPFRARWRVTEICLVGSRLDAGGARYETLAGATIQKR